LLIFIRIHQELFSAKFRLIYTWQTIHVNVIQ
jgi:hypothetical protein